MKKNIPVEESELEDEAPVPDKAQPAMPGFKVKQILDAQKACRYWQASIPLCIFCGSIGTIVALAACVKLCMASRTLKTPLLAPVLLVIWPVLALANVVLRFIGISYPLELAASVEIARILLAFFLSLAIFTQW